MHLVDPPATLTAERTVVLRDDRVGLRAVVAIDSTALGPGFGGVRLRSYPSIGAAIDEAQRLASAMTLKNALAGIPYGGAKSVVLGPVDDADRLRLLSRFGELIADLGGTYLPGVDMGTTQQDMRVLAAAGADVTCADDDPSPFTAAGVLAAIRAAVRVQRGEPSLSGVRVLVQGVGHVGSALAVSLRAHGALVDVSDVDRLRAVELANELGGRAISPDDAVTHECDVLAPCAVARVISARTVPSLRCSVVAGAANDILDSEDDARSLAERGILFVPDFVASAGGVIWVHAQRSGWSVERTLAAVDRIGDRVVELVERADADGGTLVSVGRALGREIVEAEGSVPVRRQTAGRAER